MLYWLAVFDVPVLVAHLFVFYFGIFANITPPVALAAFAGAGIAGGDPIRTGFQALKLALAGFIVPFMFVYNPNMLMIDITNVAVTAREFPWPPIHTVVQVTITSIIGVVALSSAVEGYFKAELSIWQRVVLASGGLMLIIPEIITDLVGISLVALIFVLNIRQAKATPAV